VTRAATGSRDRPAPSFVRAESAASPPGPRASPSLGLRPGSRYGSKCDAAVASLEALALAPRRSRRAPLVRRHSRLAEA
jgi:hypothetical protein